MQCRNPVPLSACAINGLLNCAFLRTPADYANSCVFISVSLGLVQFFCRSSQLAESFLHHCSVVFWLVVRMPMLIMLQTGCDVGECAWAGSRDRGDTTCSVGIARVARLCCSCTNSDGFAMSICSLAIGSNPICSICAELDAFLDFHWF